MDVINIKCVRIQSELDRYNRSGVIPHDLLEGSYSIEDVQYCLPNMDENYQALAKKLIAEYTEQLVGNLTDLKIALRTDYNSVISNLETHHTDFVFPTVMSRYRPNINPVTALYYEAREIMRRYNPECDRHDFVLGLLQDRSFNRKLLDALGRDIARLERIIKRYYWPMSKLSNEIPLELFHARQLTKDFKYYITLFDSILYWED